MAGYHEAFWLATAAAAPLITMTVVVVVPNAGVAAYGWREAEALADVDAMFSEPGKYTSSQEQAIRAMAGLEIRTRVSLRESAVRLLWVTLSNQVVQAGLLAVSLVALVTPRTSCRVGYRSS
jgi:hypothetical protein